MNDDELMTLVRAQRDQVPMTVPLEDIVRRGRAVRTRRLVPGAAGVLAVATGVGLAVSALLPAGHQASHQPPASPAAWTVTRLSGGDISVTFNQFGNLAGLQSRLRADGVPASVTPIGRPNPACRAYPGGRLGTGPDAASPLLKKVYPQPYGHFPALILSSPTGTIPVALKIDPAALPGDAAVQLVVGPTYSAPTPHALPFLTPRVVYASPQCSGG
jgi:hypothetical protein